jgi:pimeloyl-ACP methyl ester carboxylesterase
MPKRALSQYQVHYQQQGAGPDVVLIHGFTSNLAMWIFSGLAARLADRYRVTSYDLRGHGASSAPPHGYTSDRLADDFAELHAALDLGPAYVIGHSLGGVVAMHAALRHPARVQGIVLSDSYFSGLAALEPNMQSADVWIRLQETLATVGYDIGAQVDFRRLLDVLSGLTPEDRTRLQERMGPPAVRWLTQLAPLAGTTAAEEVFVPAGLDAAALASITQPVIALYDEQTPFLATYDWLLSHLPRATGARVPGASHLALLENPETFADLVCLHLDGLTGNAPAPSIDRQPA